MTNNTNVEEREKNTCFYTNDPVHPVKPGSARFTEEPPLNHSHSILFFFSKNLNSAQNGNQMILNINFHELRRNINIQLNIEFRKIPRGPKRILSNFKFKRNWWNKTLVLDSGQKQVWMMIDFDRAKDCQRTTTFRISGYSSYHLTTTTWGWWPEDWIFPVSRCLRDELKEQ